MQARNVISVAVAMLGASGSASCFDPVHSDDVKALGGEVNGVSTGPRHRPGQPCLVCHGGHGPGSPEFSIAGTIYGVRADPEALPGVTVVLQDASGGPPHSVLSNEAGNFYIAVDSWAPVFPISVTLQDARAEKGGVKEMVSTIGRNGSCAFCHYGGDNEPTHMPPVFLRLGAIP